MKSVQHHPYFAVKAALHRRLMSLPVDSDDDAKKNVFSSSREVCEALLQIAETLTPSSSSSSSKGDQPQKRSLHDAALAGNVVACLKNVRHDENDHVASAIIALAGPEKDI